MVHDAAHNDIRFSASKNVSATSAPGTWPTRLGAATRLSLIWGLPDAPEGFLGTAPRRPNLTHSCRGADGQRECCAGSIGG
jgi:hypothetical protein